MRGDPMTTGVVRRYWKFSWDNLDILPVVGKTDYQPKDGGACRLYDEGQFFGENLEAFPPVKTKKHLPPFGRCVYCNRYCDTSGVPLKLTSEHIIPEFLGAGLELPVASCAECQKFTSSVESSIARTMFDPVRKAFALEGKGGVLQKSNFPLDVGRETTDHQFIPLVHYPTLIVMPFLYPASTYSNRSINFDGLFNFRIYNINANAIALKKYALENFSTQSIDMIRFSQFITKIAHAYAMHHFRAEHFDPVLASFIRTDYHDSATARDHLKEVGCLWNTKDIASNNLHEVEAGSIVWNGEITKAVRVRLFASYGMPSYYVTVGKPYLKK
jgi:hypothetical protein